MDFIVRPIAVGDGPGINALRRMPGVFEHILGIPSERVNRNEDWILSLGGNDHVFVAVTADKKSDKELVIGNIGLSVAANPRRRHTAGFGMMVHRDYQGMGVGKALLEAALDIADNWLMLHRVELTVYADNERAIGLYKKYGFVEEGLMKDYAIRDGAYVDTLQMARLR